MSMLNIKEVSEALAVTQQVVHRLMSKGLLPFINVGGKSLRFKQSDLEKFIELNTRNWDAFQKLPGMGRL